MEQLVYGSIGSFCVIKQIENDESIEMFMKRCMI